MTTFKKLVGIVLIMAIGLFVSFDAIPASYSGGVGNSGMLQLAIFLSPLISDSDGSGSG
ncbi:3757_t:CDS:2 [Ambispora gerdemannii]|uniref:3757_t:CDS:1 n=1 Tax=Ambispora gerdemannii TaxID=144530 RepID=A0A9N9DD96_9GLOM|nr:3757_t:CDS:2 [Ambispora gerdemannii]